ncbi:MAG TPA: DUF2085 domain-containing protein [Polyangiaceae bacterium]|nr:DUF2085 domain-containing protein [Polyangiaceae bacterium]
MKVGPPAAGSRAMSKAALVTRVLGALIVLWPIAPPLLHHLGVHGVAAALEAPWALSCHRMPDRTLRVFGYAMPMCSRCMGLDVGFALGLLAGAPYRGPKLMWAWMAAALALLLVEHFTQEWGLHPIWHGTRFLTGALLAYPIGAAVTALANARTESSSTVVESAPD